MTHCFHANLLEAGNFFYYSQLKLSFAFQIQYRQVLEHYLINTDAILDHPVNFPLTNTVSKGEFSSLLSLYKTSEY